MVKTTTFTALLIGLILTGGGTARAQEEPSPDEQIKLFRKDMRSVRKQVIAANMDLTDPEAQQFWPIFDQYTAELVKANDQKYELIKEFAVNYETLTDEQAEKYIKGRAAVDQSISDIRLKYFPIFRKVLSGVATARFFQIDWRIGLIIDVQLSAEIPLIEP